LWAASLAPEARLPLPIHCMARTEDLLLAEILQYQCRVHLGLETKLMPEDANSLAQTVMGDGEWRGVCGAPYVSVYPDANDLLSFFTAGYPNWSDPEYNRMLVDASSTPDPTRRVERLAACEARLLRAMPLVPLYFVTWNYLERPEVRGLRLNALNTPSFKYAWIDPAKWRAS
jgi:ABC-type oligopeptide transport system substrate-binding subunit